VGKHGHGCLGCRSYIVYDLPVCCKSTTL